ncbi:MAG: TerB family tellurite resistance protein [Alphaproteobacteria bacterium]
MIDAFRNFIRDLAPASDAAPASREDDVRLAAAALLFHVIGIDGVVGDEEQATLHDLLQVRFSLTDEDVGHLIKAAGAADTEAIDLYGFTSALKQNMEIAERERVIEMMWQLVFADGAMHEFEDNLVWRVAELLGVSGPARIRLKQSVRDGDG